MELTFTQTNKKSWVAEFEASSDFNIHIEREETGSIKMSQRTAPQGEPAEVDEFSDKRLDGKKVIDYDCRALVYPKSIRIVSEVKPKYAEVTFAE